MGFQSHTFKCESEACGKTIELRATDAPIAVRVRQIVDHQTVKAVEDAPAMAVCSIECGRKAAADLVDRAFDAADKLMRDPKAAGRSYVFELQLVASPS